MMSKKYKAVFDQVVEALDEAALIKGPIQDYVEFLEEVASHVEISMDAAKEDIKRLGLED